MNANKDFFETVVTGHVIACALNVLEMTAVHQLPAESIIPNDAWMSDDKERQRILMNTAKRIEENVDLSVTFASDSATQQMECMLMPVKSLAWVSSTPSLETPLRREKVNGF